MNTRRTPLERHGWSARPVGKRHTALATAGVLAFSVVAALTGNGIATAAAPANDNFASATTLTSLSGSVAGSTVGATQEANEGNIWPGESSCPADDQSVWYSWTAPTTAYMLFATVLTEESHDSTLGVYTGSTIAALTVVAENDEQVVGLNHASKVAFLAVENTTYRIRVAAACGVQWPFTLTWQQDNIAPVFTTAATVQMFNKWTARVTFRATDDLGVATTCRVNDSEYARCSSQWKIELPRGTHTLEIKATDLAGNVSTSSATVTITPGRIRVVPWPPTV